MDIRNRSVFRVLANAYIVLASGLLTTLLMLVLLDLAFSFAFKIRDHYGANPVTRKYADPAAPGTSQRVWAALYPGASKAQVDDLLKETWTRRLEYEPYTQFRERPYRGRYVNVEAAGFRRSAHQGPWPPAAAAVNVFVFGGSTTFGYGVADGDTIPSRIQERLSATKTGDIHVYNFGRGFYYSTQERILYQQLLARGFVPDIALFIDGINEFDFNYRNDEPEGSSEWRAFVDSSAAESIASYLSGSALGRAAGAIRRRLGSGEAPGTAMKLTQHDERALSTIVLRYLENKRQIETQSVAYGVLPFFVWQPAPIYKYDQRFHAFPVDGYRERLFPFRGYQEIARIRELASSSDFFWAADMQVGSREPLYVDRWHYSPMFSRTVAYAIVEAFVARTSPRSAK